MPEEHVYTEKHLLVEICKWLICPEDKIVEAYADSLLLFGINNALAVYDLLRVFLKIRSNLRPSVRRCSPPTRTGQAY